MRTRIVGTAALVVLLPALALAWGGGAPPPSDPVTVALVPPDGRLLTLGPYTANDYSGDVYDPVNLFFLDSDPREIRQALLGLDPSPRGEPWASLPIAGCVWADGMGSEQVAWAEPEGWVGGEVQLVCVNPTAPLGDPFRVHLRLYRQGDVTLGAAHFEILIPGTAQHEVLSWDLARDFVAGEMARTGPLTALPYAVLVKDLAPEWTFREIRRQIYDALYYDPTGQGLALLAGLGLVPPPSDPTEDVPIPTNGMAMVISAYIVLDPGWTVTRSKVEVEYDVVTPRPFCATGPYDLVHLAGPIRLTNVVYTTPWGTYHRRHRISGTLMVTPLMPDGAGGYTPTGPPAPAVIRENHQAVLNDWYGQLMQSVSQTLLSDPRQTLRWKLLGGEYDRYYERENCGDWTCGN
jgi:hypothetical protein